MTKQSKTIEKEELILKEITLKDLKVGDVIYLTPKACKAIGYTVLDIGDPFMLIEDTAHFANLYRVTGPLYIEDVINSKN